MRKLAVVAVLSAVALSGCAEADEAAHEEDKPAKTPAAAAIAWGTCPAPSSDPRLTCGTLKVPLNYQDPGGASISVAVSKLTTAKAGEKRGVMFVNPGGPALSGLDTPVTMAATLPESVLNAYDLIGFDPRGVENSTPQSCGLGDILNVSLFPYPAADGTITKNVEAAKQVAQKCAANPNLKYYTTVNTARDMDRMRIALGADKIAYWGQSYGTYLGEAYDSLFPAHVDKMVLEGNVDPARAWANEITGWGKAMADRFPDAAAVAAQQTGQTVKQVTDGYLALADRLDREPAAIPGTQMSLDGGLLRNITYGLLLHNENLQVLPSVWKAAADLADGKLTDADTAVFKQVFGSTATTEGVPGDNSAAMFLALECGDVAWSSDVSGAQAAVTADRKAWPLTAGMPASVWPCSFWTYQPLDKPVTVTSQGARNIMILQNRRDNATPWESGMGLRTELGQRAVFVGVENGGHYVYHSGSACADEATVAFLAAGTMPAKDLDCSDVK